VLISSAVSQRSRTSSTIRATGRRTANERALEWLNPEVDRSREREEGDAGDDRPDGGLEEGLESGPIGKPLYSGNGVCGGASSPDVMALGCRE
jgi:hypothetical protein